MFYFHSKMKMRNHIKVSPQNTGYNLYFMFFRTAIRYCTVSTFGSCNHTLGCTTPTLLWRYLWYKNIMYHKKSRKLLYPKIFFTVLNCKFNYLNNNFLRPFWSLNSITSSWSPATFMSYIDVFSAVE